MKLKKLILSVLILLINFLFFALPFVILIFGSYDLINCSFLNINICRKIFDIYGFNAIFLLLFLGLLISIFSFLSNFLNNKLKNYFSILYSFVVLIFILFVLNFGKVNINLSDFLSEVGFRGNASFYISFKPIFYLFTLSILIDIARKILLLKS